MAKSSTHLAPVDHAIVRVCTVTLHAFNEIISDSRAPICQSKADLQAS